MPYSGTEAINKDLIGKSPPSIKNGKRPLTHQIGSPNGPQHSSGRLSINLVSNLSFFAVNIIIGLWFTPYLIKNLGTAVYGLYPLIKTITGYMAVITNSLNSAVSRFLTVSLSRGEVPNANEYFNTSLLSILIVAIMLIMPVTWAALNIERLIDVPHGREHQATLLFLLVGAAFLLNTVKMPFGVSTYFCNRFDLRSLINFSERFSNIGLVVLLFAFIGPNLWMVGAGVVLGALIMLVGETWYWRRLTPELSISLSRFKCAKLKQLTTMGTWASIDSIGVILFLGIDLLVVNRMFGAEAGGRYAAVLQWSILLRAMATTVALVFGPTVLHLFANNQIDSLLTYLRRAIKCVGVMISLPVGLICGLSAPLLITWLGNGFSDLGALMALQTIHLSINLAILPLFRVQVAANRMRTPAVVVLIMGACNLALAIILAGPLGWGLYGVAAAGAIALSLKNLIFSPLYVAHILKSPPTVFLREVFPIAATALMVAGLSFLFSCTMDLIGWPRIIFFTAAVSAVYLPFVYFVLFNAAERQLVMALISKYKK